MTSDEARRAAVARYNNSPKGRANQERNREAANAARRERYAHDPGLAHNRCNILIGWADDDPERLRRIATVLEIASKRLSAMGGDV